MSLETTSTMGRTLISWETNSFYILKILTKNPYGYI